MKGFLKVFALVGLMALSACGEKEPVVVIHTQYGDMRVVLYDQTPLHKENFLRLADAGDYDNTTFHRVIKNFMVQGGDINRVQANAIDYTIPFEYDPELFHQKGALSAARQGEQVNPERASSGSQFYIVQGATMEPDDIKMANNNMMMRSFDVLMGKVLAMEKYQELRQGLLDLQTRTSPNEFRDVLMSHPDLLEAIATEYGAFPTVEYTQDQLNTYAEVGGSPHLDGGYTVFGQVIDGLNVIDSIAAVDTWGQFDRDRPDRVAPDQPKNDITMTMDIEMMTRKEIEKKYGFIFPGVPEENQN